jgi:hypothetical protein
MPSAKKKSDKKISKTQIKTSVKKKKSSTGKKKRPLNEYLKASINAKKKGLDSFKYKAKNGIEREYVSALTKSGMKIFKLKSGQPKPASPKKKKKSKKKKKIKV